MDPIPPLGLLMRLATGARDASVAGPAGWLKFAGGPKRPGPVLAVE